MASSFKVDLISKEPVTFGEGPHWDAPRKALYYVDVLENALIELSLEGRDPIQTPFPLDKGFPHLTAAIPLLKQPEDFIGVATDKLIRFSKDSSKVDVLYEFPETAFNDAKCDSRGRFWVGNRKVYPNPEPGAGHRERTVPLAGGLRCLSAGTLGSSTSGMTAPNGLSFSPDESLLYSVDTFESNIGVQDYDPNSGQLSGKRRIVYTFDQVRLGIDPMTILDGMVTDVRGNLWVAIYMEGRVYNIDAQTGKVLSKIAIDNVPFTTSLCFGGHDLSQLFVTTCQVSLPGWSAHVPAGDLGGHTFSVLSEKDNTFKGVQAYAYGN